jgi:hypothetical protein
VVTIVLKNIAQMIVLIATMCKNNYKEPFEHNRARCRHTKEAARLVGFLQAAGPWRATDAHTGDTT